MSQCWQPGLPTFRKGRLRTTQSTTASNTYIGRCLALLQVCADQSTPPALFDGKMQIQFNNLHYASINYAWFYCLFIHSQLLVLDVPDSARFLDWWRSYRLPNSICISRYIGNMQINIGGRIVKFKQTSKALICSMHYIAGVIMTEYEITTISHFNGDCLSSDIRLQVTNCLFLQQQFKHTTQVNLHTIIDIDK